MFLSQSQSALERFHRTFKTMTYCIELQKDQGAPKRSRSSSSFICCLQDCSGLIEFPPFELIFGDSVRHPLKIVKQILLSWESKTNLLSCFDVKKGSQKHANLPVLMHNHVWKIWYDKKSRHREFNVGDQVLALTLTARVSTLVVRI